MPSKIQDLTERLEQTPDSPEKVDLLLELAGAYQSTDPKEALAKSETAVSLSEKLGDSRSLAKSIRVCGAICEQLGDYPRAVSLGMQALVMYREMGDLREVGRCLNNIGLSYTRMESFSLALDYFQRALESLSESGDVQIKAFVLNNIGMVRRSMDDHQGALECFHNSLDILKQVGDPRNQAHALSNIGLCHRQLKEPQRALEFFKHSLAIRQEIGDRYSQAHSWINISNLHRDLREYDQCRDSLMRAMDLASECGDMVTEVYILVLLGTLKTTLGELDSGLDHLEQAQPLAERLGDQSALRSLFQGFADNHEKRGNHARALLYRARSMESEVGSLKGNLEMATRNGGGPSQADDPANPGLDRLSILSAKVERLKTDFIEMLKIYSTIHLAEAKTHQGRGVRPPSGFSGWKDDDGWFETALPGMPPEAREILRGIWTDIKQMHAMTSRAGQ